MKIKPGIYFDPQDNIALRTPAGIWTVFAENEETNEQYFIDYHNIIDPKTGKNRSPRELDDIIRAGGNIAFVVDVEGSRKARYTARRNK